MKLTALILLICFVLLSCEKDEDNAPEQTTPTSPNNSTKVDTSKIYGLWYLIPDSYAPNTGTYKSYAFYKDSLFEVDMNPLWNKIEKGKWWWEGSDTVVVHVPRLDSKPAVFGVVVLTKDSLHLSYHEANKNMRCYK